MMNTLVGLFTTGLAFVLAIISTAIPYWWRYSVGQRSANMGLFQVCTSTPTVSECFSYSDEGRRTSDWLKATQAMMILSILSLAASLLLAVLFGFVMKGKSILAIGAAVMALAGGILCCLGFIIYAAKSTDILVGGLHASFGLAVIAAITAFVSVAFHFMTRDNN